MWTEQPVEEYQPKGIKKFCALIEVELVMPICFETYGRLSTGGLILNINTDYLLQQTASGELALHALNGEVNASHVSADVFHANTIISPIRIDSVHRAPMVSPWMSGSAVCWARLGA
ncbi:hypothetical protein BG006_005479 [Podila minutissima]|uniref:Uncharacterized protein n=1 Tax=Podila minutissima TaxID=64525 RepID=A0A9P5SN00_9FUNG|nr:hypothetical protein BG006_005479 [Podila minutissima]